MAISTHAPLSGRGGWRQAAWCVTAAFGAYFCMYGFRKPFTAATFSNVEGWEWSYKSMLVIAQVLGYTISKFVGIKVVSEMVPGRRVLVLLGLVAAAEVALLGFAMTPPPYNVVWLFLNGLPLGIVFGLVLGFLEGRRQTELLVAGLCISFIVADGFVKSVGATLLSVGVSEFWMPALAGLCFAGPLIGFSWMLSRIPAPSTSDVAARSERAPMDGGARIAFFWRYGIGLTLLATVYLLITILRSIRADFTPEIWKGLGVVDVRADLYTWTEVLVGVAVLAVSASSILIVNNRSAFFTGLFMAAAGTVFIMGALLALPLGLPPFVFMVLQGMGIFVPYVVVHTTLFERLIAMTRDRGNIGYLLYLVDAFGYLGYVGVLLVHDSIGEVETFLPFYLLMSWVVAGLCLLLILPCWWYFSLHSATRAMPRDETVAVKKATAVTVESN